MAIKIISKEEVLKNKEYYAELWCERNKDLRQVLLFLWNKGIWTCGCCSGHNGQKQAYVGLEIGDNYKTILKVLSAVNKENIIISFVVSSYKKIVGLKANTEEVFKKILKMEYKENDKDLEQIMKYILTLNSTYANVRLHYKNNKFNLYINTSDKKLITKLKEKYDFMIINEKNNMHHFIIK